MNRLKRKWWAKAVAAILCVISLLVGVVSICAMIGDSQMSPEELAKELDEQIARNYSAAILDLYNEAADEEDFYARAKDLVDPKLSFAVVKSTQESWYDAQRTAKEIGAFKAGAEYLCGNMDTVKNATFVLAGGENFYYSYSLNSLSSMLQRGYASQYSGSFGDDASEDVSWVLYDQSTGIFYYATDSGYYPVHTVVIGTDRAGTRYELKRLDTNMQEAYYAYVSALGTLLDPDCSDWVYVQLENSSCAIRELTTVEEDVYDDPGNHILVMENMDYFIEDGLVHGYEDTYISDGRLIHADAKPPVYYYVFSYVDDSVTNTGYYSFFEEVDSLMGAWEILVDFAVVLEVISVILFLVTFLFLLYAAGWKEMEETVCLAFLDRVWLEVISALAFLLEVGCGAFMFLFFEEGILKTRSLLVVEAELIFVMGMVFLLYCMTIASRIKAKKFFRYTIFYWCYKFVAKIWKKCWSIVAKIWKKCWSIVGNVWSFFRQRHRSRKEFYRTHVSLFWRTIIGLFVASIVFVVSFAIFCVGYFDEDLYVLWVFVFLILMWLATLSFVTQVTKIVEGGARIAKGDLSSPIDTRGLMRGFKEHAQNINQVGDGIANAVEHQMKSERFKTELITNVSHDIKTPLTSIINYVDLIKKEDITDEKLQEYVEVLDRQSARLKKLIEDLMEASKASTGNLTVNFEPCDARVLLTQIVGEFEEKTRANQLEMIVENPKEPMNILVDSRHIWRVFDNLLNNICKYAQPSTRVYINLVQEGNEAVITFKNISKYQLNITSDELLERFVRGDSSRNTEGSGLGLSIAQSLTNLMKGSLTLAVDGDLFKVILRFPIIL